MLALTAAFTASSEGDRYDVAESICLRNWLFDSMEFPRSTIEAAAAGSSPGLTSRLPELIRCWLLASRSLVRWRSRSDWRFSELVTVRMDMAHLLSDSFPEVVHQFIGELVDDADEPRRGLVAPLEGHHVGRLLVQAHPGNRIPLGLERRHQVLLRGVLG